MKKIKVILVLFIIGITIAIFITPLLQKGNPIDTYRTRRYYINTISHAIMLYEDHYGCLPYSEKGEDDALQKLITFMPEIRHYSFPIRGMVKNNYPDGSTAYIYINPKPSEYLSQDTIILIERDYFYGDDKLYAILRSDRLILIENGDKYPEKLIGTEYED